MIATVLLIAIAVILTVIGTAAVLVLWDVHDDRVDADTERVLAGISAARTGRSV